MSGYTPTLAEQLELFGRKNGDFAKSAETIFDLLSRGVVPRQGNIQADLSSALLAVRQGQAALLPLKKTGPGKLPFEDVCRRLVALYAPIGTESDI